MRYTNETMDQHIKSYDKIKSSVLELNKGKFLIVFIDIS